MSIRFFNFVRIMLRLSKVFRIVKTSNLKAAYSAMHNIPSGYIINEGVLSIWATKITQLMISGSRII